MADMVQGARSNPRSSCRMTQKIEVRLTQQPDAGVGTSTLDGLSQRDESTELPIVQSEEFGLDTWPDSRLCMCLAGGKGWNTCASHRLACRAEGRC